MSSSVGTERAIAEVRALLGEDSDLVIAALANAPLEAIRPAMVREHLAGPDLSRNQDRSQ
jgi:hypothetical protein